MNEIEKELSRLNGTQDEAYEKKVTCLIRKRYSLSAELALGRQKDKKPEEWEAYNAYCEQCKAEAKATVYGEEVVPR